MKRWKTTVTAVSLMTLAASGSAFASTTGDPDPSGGRTVIVAKGNENAVAGHDLIQGGENVTGTGHVIGERLGDDEGAQICVQVVNSTQVNLTNGVVTSGNFTQPTLTNLTLVEDGVITDTDATTLQPGEIGIACAAQQSPGPNVKISYNVPNPAGFDDIDFSATQVSPTSPPQESYTTTSGYEIAVISRDGVGTNQQNVSFNICQTSPNTCAV